MGALLFQGTQLEVESHVPFPSSTRMWSKMAAQQRMTQMENTGVQPGPLVPTAMLAVATGGIVQIPARQSPLSFSLP